jgi:hypothetical protein
MYITYLSYLCDTILYLYHKIIFIKQGLITVYRSFFFPRNLKYCGCVVVSKLRQDFMFFLKAGIPSLKCGSGSSISPNADLDPAPHHSDENLRPLVYKPARAPF